MPGWPIRVYVPGLGPRVSEVPVLPALMTGQEKSATRGHVVRKVRVIALREAEETRPGGRAGGAYP